MGVYVQISKCCCAGDLAHLSQAQAEHHFISARKQEMPFFVKRGWQDLIYIF